MKKTLFIFPVFVLLLFLAGGFSASGDFAKGEEAFNRGQYHLAIEKYTQYLLKEKDKASRAIALFHRGICYYKITMYKNAEAAFGKAIKASLPGAEDPEMWLWYARCKKINMKLEEAKVAYGYYKEKRGTQQPDFIAWCDSATYWKNHPSGYIIENTAMLNSGEWDLSPSIGDSANRSLYFISMRPLEGKTLPVDKATGNFFGQIYYATVDSPAYYRWSTPRIVFEYKIYGKNNNSLYFSTKEQRLYFSQKIPQREKPGSPDAGCFFYTHLVMDTAAPPSGVDGFGLENFTTPFQTNDHVLYFASDRPGGFGGYDIWSARYDERLKHWSEPENLGAEINSAADELAPFLRENGTLYFSSDRVEGMGGFDIFSALPNGKNWSEPVNLRYPLNSTGDEIGIVFDGKKPWGYLSSNREGTKGGFDIWRFYVVPR